MLLILFFFRKKVGLYYVQLINSSEIGETTVWNLVLEQLQMKGCWITTSLLWGKLQIIEPGYFLLCGIVSMPPLDNFY